MKDKITCFGKTILNNEDCKNTECIYWYENANNKNCIINASNEKCHTLQEIGDIFNISRMRVCQIEKKSIQKIKKYLDS
tara:strand:+ start:26670 stop:26906 length:237 start_codon:yes stop_codon:yes gene_type:complete